MLCVRVNEYNNAYSVSFGASIAMQNTLHCTGTIYMHVHVHVYTHVAYMYSTCAYIQGRTNKSLIKRSIHVATYYEHS